jgi:S1-C subfamily serine protease
MSSLTTISEQLVEAVAAAGRFVVSIDVGRRFPASGVLWSADTIVTAEHSVKRDDDLKVTLPDGRAVNATLAGRDGGTDIAVLKIEPVAAPARTVAPEESIRPGAFTIAVGRAPEFGAHAALGIISAVRGEWQTWRGGRLDRYIRLDLNLFPGLSGAAVVDTEGRLIGFATSGLSRIAAVAIPATTADRVVNEILTKGYVSRAYLGVGLQPVALQGHEGAALMVVSLEPNGPAATSGLLLGDIVLAVDGKAVADTDDVQSALSGRASGTVVTAKVLRAGERRDVAVTLGERPVERHR